MTRAPFLLLTLALMCENVNAAPQDKVLPDYDFRILKDGSSDHAGNPASAAPFILSHPICPGGFWIAQRFDERNSAGTIIKSVWVRKCTKGRIVYGRKV